MSRCESNESRKITALIYSRLRLTIEIYENSGQPIATVPCLHLGNIYIKRKLGEWRAQKYNP